MKSLTTGNRSPARPPPPDAIDGYWRYERGLVPQDPPVPPPKKKWFTLARNGLSFFVADTRTERDSRLASNVDARQVFAPAQWSALTNWLTTTNGPKFIVCPSILLPLHLKAQHTGVAAGPIHSDGWDGYPASLHSLLAFIAENGIDHVVFLSGDEHRACVSNITVTTPMNVTVQVHSIHSSPLYGPFPFANSLAEDFLPNESDTFSDGTQTYAYTVAATFPYAGNGFTTLCVDNSSGTWVLNCHFEGGTAVPPIPLQ
jgi:cholesterol oxidase